MVTPNSVCPRMQRAAALAFAAIALFHLPVGLSAKEGHPNRSAPRSISFDTDDFTWSSVDIVRSGDKLVFDVLGDIYSVSLSGGVARTLRNGNAWDRRPRVSPDGRYLAFISDENGTENVWLMRTDGGPARRLTSYNEPYLQGSITSLQWYGDAQIVVQTGLSDDLEFVATGLKERSGNLPHCIYYTPGPGPRILCHDPITHSDRTVVEGDPQDLLFGPIVSDDQSTLIFGRRRVGVTALMSANLVTGEVETIRDALMANGFEKELPIDLLPGFGISRDGKRIWINMFGKIQQLSALTGEAAPIGVHAKVRSRILPQPFIKQPKAQSLQLGSPQLLYPDRKLIYSAGGKIEVWDVDQKRSQRLTTSTDIEIAPSLSPKARIVAYTSWNHNGLAHIMVSPVDGGPSLRLTTRPAYIISFAWSPDGKSLVYIKGTSERRVGGGFMSYGEGPWSIEALDLASGLSTELVKFEAPPYGGVLKDSPVLQFSADGQYLTYRRGSGRETVQLNLATRQKETVFRYDDSIAEVIPSPDGDMALAVGAVDFWLLRFTSNNGGLTNLSVSEDGTLRSDRPAEIKYIGNRGAQSPHWDTDGRIIWSIGDRIKVLDAHRGKSDEYKINQAIAYDAPTEKLVIRNVRLITVDKFGVIEHGAIAIADGKIEYVGPAADLKVRPGWREIDLGGRTIIPGFVDVHSHMNYPQLPHTNNSDEQLALSYGITTAFDPSTPMHVFEFAELAQAGAVRSPRLFASGVIFGPLSAAKPLQTTSRVNQRAVLYANSGARMLKSYAFGRRSDRRALADAARYAKVGITAEGREAFPYYLSAVADGYNAMEHFSFSFPIRNDVLKFLAGSGVSITPTVTVAQDDFDSDYYFEKQGESELNTYQTRFFPPELQSQQPDKISYHHAYVEQVAQNVVAMIRAGVPISIGSHARIRSQGINFHWEMWMLARAGASPNEILEAATMNGARKLQLDAQIGSLTPGKLADLVILNSNPLTDIRKTVEIEYVVRRGRFYDPRTVQEEDPADAHSMEDR